MTGHQLMVKACNAVAGAPRGLREAVSEWAVSGHLFIWTRLNQGYGFNMRAAPDQQPRMAVVDKARSMFIVIQDNHVLDTRRRGLPTRRIA